MQSERNQSDRAQAQLAPQAKAVPTYQSIGIYWSPDGGSPTNRATVQYRRQGETAWQNAQPLWYDTRTIGGKSPEYRGSIVQLQAGTVYEVRLTLASGPSTTITTTTWTDPEKLPIARTINIPAGGPYTITEGGTPDGYVLYTTNPGNTITASTVASTNQNAVNVDASYVIVRGLTVRGGMNGIAVRNSAHHVVVDRNDISGWGPNCPDGPGKCGTTPWSGVRADSGGVAYHHLTVQRNRIHDPNYTSNLWCEGFNGPGSTEHPHGVRGVSFYQGSYNNVVRYNEITGSLQRMYDDGMGNDNNFTADGFPNADSDINGNIVMNVADDAIESEGGNENVRIWGNYIDQTFVGIGNASVTVGPIYIFRNVMDRSDVCPRDADGGYNSTSNSKEFIKVDDSQDANSGGFRFVAHNTLLQRPGTSGAQNGFFVTQQAEGKMKNTVSRNNIFNAITYPYRAATSSVFVNDDFDYDLAPRNNSNTTVGSHFLIGQPIYATGNGNSNGFGGMYQLAPNSPGYDAGQVLANFSDGFIGSAPDMGAHEAGAPRMEFGVNAYLTQPSTGTVTTPTATPVLQYATPTPTTATVTLGVGMSVSPSTVVAGNNVTASATVTGNTTVSRVEFYLDNSLRGTDTTAPYAITWAPTAVGTHTLTARAYDTAGNGSTSIPVTLVVNPAPTNTPVPTLTPTPAPIIHGLRGQYFNSIDFTNLALTRTDNVIDFSWAGGSPAPSLLSNKYSVRWRGYVVPPASGTWTFFTDSDEGVRVWVNNTRIINNWTSHTLTRDSGSMSLNANTRYPIQIDYYENRGSAQMKLYWRGPGVSTITIIPSSRLVAQ